MPDPKIHIPKDEIVAWCTKWKVVEFSLFGSVLTDRFRPESDVDVMVSFAPNENWNLFDIVTMTDELKVLFGRNVDLVEKDTLRNPFRRKAILDSHEVIHAV